MENIVCPTVLGLDLTDFTKQIKTVSKFAKRIQIDLMDGKFATTKSVNLDDIWIPAHLDVDLHLMFDNPIKKLDQLIALKPHLVIIHAESNVNHMHMAALLHQADIKAGLAILPETSITDVEQILNSFDHLLIFSGNLGHFGGQADLNLLGKVSKAKEHHPDLEIGWDGGINDSNISALKNGGVNVLNVGSFIHKADVPVNNFLELEKRIA